MAPEAVADVKGQNTRWNTKAGSSVYYGHDNTSKIAVEVILNLPPLVPINKAYNADHKKLLNELRQNPFWRCQMKLCIGNIT